MPPNTNGQSNGWLAYGWDAVNPALCCSMRICSSANLRKKFRFLAGLFSTCTVRFLKSRPANQYHPDYQPAMSTQNKGSKLTTIRNNLINIPQVRFLQAQLIPIDLLMSLRPIRQRTLIRPQRHPRWNMYQLKQPTLTLKRFTIMSLRHVDLEESVVVP